MRPPRYHILVEPALTGAATASDRLCREPRRTGGRPETEPEQRYD